MERGATTGGGRRLLRTGAIALGLLAAAVALLATIDLLRIRADLAHAQDALAGATLSDVRANGGLEPLAASADAAATRAAGRASGSPWLRIAAVLPLVDREVDGVREIAGTVSEVTAIVRERATEIDRLLDRPVTGASRTEVLGALLALSRRTGADLAAIDPPHAGGLVGAITDADRQLTAALADAGVELREATASLRALRDVVQGPRRFLVLAANNAEMRGAGGMPLHAGVVTIGDGQLDATRFRPTSELLLDRPVRVPRSIDELYGWLGPGREWRNTTTSPNFPAVAPVYRRLARAAGLGRVDGVIQIDVIALARLLEELGPVRLDGRTYSAAALPRVLLHDLYLQFDWRNDERHALLGRLATATLRQLDARGWDPLAVAQALSDAGAGRHLLLWSARPAEQRAWASLGMSGALDPDGLLVAVQNHGANKLDWFLEPELSIDVGAPDAGWRDVEVGIELTNDAPAGLPGSVAGDGRGSLVPGDYRAFVTAYLPADATAAELDGATLRVVGEDGPMRVLGATLDIPRGETRQLTVTFRTAADHPLRVLPSGRARPVEMQIDTLRTDDRHVRELPG